MPRYRVVVRDVRFFEVEIEAESEEAIWDCPDEVWEIFEDQVSYDGNADIEMIEEIKDTTNSLGIIK